uniref:NADH dehydrogenase subunit 6 n=1 Tax=Provanna glabra TaxID=263137 RepID=UPI00286BB6DA|nr:NADH dehydrogenase subunit 6 [Provanna glabra]WKY20937.1 NADH dehydrogenase subunit 6 [Provanna glabra]
MTAVIILALSLSSILMFPLMAQPLSLGLAIMVSTLLMCCLSAMFLSSWYAYILFLIYVGGLLVMFAYVAALSPNVLFTGSGSFFLFILALFPAICIFWSKYYIDYGTFLSFSQASQLKYMKTYGVELVSPEMMSVLIGLGLILLVNLVVVVKICYYQQASLRPFKD